MNAWYWFKHVGLRFDPANANNEGSLTKTRRLMLALALANAIVYCCALPLWEGFDEPFHYGYVKSVAVQHRLPAFGLATLSAEIQKSLELVPLSHFLSSTIAGTLSFEEYSKIGTSERVMLSRELHNLSPDLRQKQSALLNYESQQAPLAYVALAPFDMLLSPLPLPARILSLRFLGALAAAAIVYASLRKLSDLVALDAAVEPAIFLCVFASQMLWASVAHVGNDWLSVPLTLSFIVSVAAAARSTGAREQIILALIFTAGLLTKAYFLAFTPVFLAALFRMARARVRRPAIALAFALPLVVAGPWYYRNFSIYGSVSGTQESIAGIGAMQVAAALPKVPWLTSVPDFLRWSLWTGNWSFISFSKTTLNAELALLCLGVVLYVRQGSRISTAGRWIVAACVCFVGGLIFQTGSTWISSGAQSKFAEPWYGQGVIPIVWLVALSGLSRSGLAGRACGALLCLLSAWIAAMTYLAKMLPGYATGFRRSTLGNVADWWLNDAAHQSPAVTLAPAAVVYITLMVFLVLLIFATVAAARSMWASGRPS